MDMSLGAVREGVTDPRAVQTLMARGVRVFTRASLHAKFIVTGQTLIASSANASHNSREALDEAGIITNDPAAVRRAVGFFEKLCTEPVRKKYLAKCIGEYRPPRFKAAVDTRQTSSNRARPQSNYTQLTGQSVPNLPTAVVRRPSNYLSTRDSTEPHRW